MLVVNYKLFVVVDFFFKNKAKTYKLDLYHSIKSKIEREAN
jgi:hypothetical protein